MQQRKVIHSSTQKPDNSKSGRPKSSLLSWIFNRHENNNDSPSSATMDEASIKTEANNNYVSVQVTERENYVKTSYSAPTTAPMHRESNKHSSAGPRRFVEERQTIVTRTEIVVHDSGLPNQSSTNMNSSINDSSEIQIPNRRQSHLYTPFHDQFQSINSNNNDIENVISDHNSKRRSCYVSHLSPIPDPSNSTSSLARSASWQPSSSSALLSPNQLQNLGIESIPARRTSRNYSEDPEIQAKLNALLNSEKTFYLSHVLQNNNNNSEIVNKNNNTNMYRRSTTPANRPL